VFLDLGVKKRCHADFDAGYARFERVGKELKT
jgi:hypothetical protein